MNVLFSAELQRRLDRDGLRASVVSLHPGVVATDLGRYLVRGSDAASTDFATLSPAQRFLASALNFVILPVDRGANTQVFLAANSDNALDPNDFSAHGGLYYDNMRPVTPSPVTQDSLLASELWRRASELTGFSLL